MLTPTQRGTAGEQLFAACVTLSSVGELELFKPLTDDDHTDITAGRRGKVPALAIQVVTKRSSSSSTGWLVGAIVAIAGLLLVAIATIGLRNRRGNAAKA